MLSPFTDPPARRARELVLYVDFEWPPLSASLIVKLDGAEQVPQNPELVFSIHHSIFSTFLLNGTNALDWQEAGSGPI